MNSAVDAFSTPVLCQDISTPASPLVPAVRCMYRQNLWATVQLRALDLWLSTSADSLSLPGQRYDDTQLSPTSSRREPLQLP
nr:hypothetical protein CFP56_44364 [Quercus suber]